MKEYYLRTEDMAVGYRGKPLIEHIDLRLGRGEIMTLIGPNGSGKSTILKSIIRQLRLLAGVVCLAGEPMEGMPPQEVAQKLSVLMTDRSQPELMTCRDVAAAGRYPYTGKLGLLTAADWEKVDEALALVHGADLADQDFTAISDGQRQRVLLARALCQEPEILVLDEPTSFLDIRYKLELLGILKDLVRQRKIAVVLSLHELDLAQRISDIVVCVHNNTIERYGPPEEIFTADYIPQLYDVTQGSYEPAFGSLELAKVAGKPEVFVVGGLCRRGSASKRSGLSRGTGPGGGGDRGGGLRTHRPGAGFAGPASAGGLPGGHLYLSRVRPHERREPPLVTRSPGPGKAGAVGRRGRPWLLSTIFTPMEKSSAAASPPAPARPWRPWGRPGNSSPALGRRRSPCAPPRA